MTLEDFQNKVSFMTRHFSDDHYEHLDNTEIEDLLSMTSDVLLKIKLHTRGN